MSKENEFKNFTFFSRDTPIPEFIGKPDTINVQLDDCGLSIYVFMRRPNSSEIKNCSASSDLKVRLLMKSGIIFFLIKFGDLPWMDAPYTVHLSKNLTHLIDIPDNTGYFATVLLVDTATGKPAVIRGVTIDTSVSRLLNKMIQEQKELPFDHNVHNATIQSIYSKYSTKELLKQAFKF